MLSALLRGNRETSRFAAALVAGTLLGLSPGLSPPAAEASPETLRRAIGNIVQSPLDVVLAPVVAGRTLVRNLQDVDDTLPVQIVYAAPGYCWLVGVQVGGGVIRGIAGLLELVPGILLFPIETDLDALYDPADRGGALIELENPLAESEMWKYNPFVSFNVRFGVTYTSAEY